MSLRHIITPEERRKKLKILLAEKKLLRIIEAHNGLSAIIANDANVINQEINSCNFDGIWESSFTDSASKGFPDIELISGDSRIHTIQEILNVSNKPLIVDGNTGGEATHFEYFCSMLERLGVSAVIIEDKILPKRNSLDPGAIQKLESPSKFANKIKRAQKTLLSDEFMIIARIESFIANRGLNDALDRAATYLSAGADGIAIHSRKEDPQEILHFAKEYKQLCREIGIKKPLVCIPTTYNTILESELAHHGFNIVIYANHLLRASFLAMHEVCKIILESSRAYEAEDLCSPLKEVFEAVGFSDINNKDLSHEKISLCAVIPAAGKPNADLRKKFGEIPVSAIMLNNKSLLQRQTEVLNSTGLLDIYVVTGYMGDKIHEHRVKKIENSNFRQTYILESLFMVEEAMSEGFLMVYADILFNESLLEKILILPYDIVLIIDYSFGYQETRITKPNIELVVTQEQHGRHYRRLYSSKRNKIQGIGCQINKELATHEFIGIAYFSKRGSQVLREIYNDCRMKYVDKEFHEAHSFQTASFTDLIQEVIDRGYPVYGLEVNNGWHELQNKEDFQHLLEEIQ